MRRAESDEGGIGWRRRRTSFGPAAARSRRKFQRRPDRLIGFVGWFLVRRRNPGSECRRFPEFRFDFAVENRRQRRALCDQLGLGLLDQLFW